MPVVSAFPGLRTSSRAASPKGIPLPRGRSKDDGIVYWKLEAEMGTEVRCDPIPLFFGRKCCSQLHLEGC